MNMWTGRRGTAPASVGQTTPLLSGSDATLHSRRHNSLHIEGVAKAATAALRFKRRTTLIVRSGKVLHKPVGTWGAFLFIR